jgi:hypothetical protein
MINVYQGIPCFYEKVNSTNFESELSCVQSSIGHLKNITKHTIKQYFSSLLIKLKLYRSNFSIKIIL